MPRWIERRGFTLRVPDIEQRNGAAARQGYVRLSLMERVGLVSGWFNVREARAETAEAGDDAGISGGRALSWRWLRKPEADRLLEQRLETLETMGYTLVDAAMTVRGRWDWLYDLVHRQLHGKDDADRVAATADPPPADALRHALSRLGLSPDAVIEGVAAVLSLTPHALSHPDAAVVRRTDPEELGVLLPFLLRHEHADVHEIGQRWLRCPEVAYQLPRNLLLGWLENDEGIGRVLGPRLQAEGLAMLGPDALLRLSRTGSAPVRGPARTWSQRLGSV